MQWLIDLILKTGESVVHIMLYSFLPVMVAMSGIMALLDYWGILKWIQRALTPIFRKIGIPGLGVIAMIQLSFIGFAAPIPTLSLIERDRGISTRAVAATLAMMFALPQANVTFPMAAYGLDFPLQISISLLGGIFAATLTYFVFGRRLSSREDEPETLDIVKQNKPASAMDAMNAGGILGMKMVAKAFPMFLFALIIVNILRDIGFVELLNRLLTPFIGDGASPYLLAGFSKYFAGGTAMMGVTMDMMENNQISILQLNRMSGFLINPMDLVGVAVYISSGPRLKMVLKPAILGAIYGIILRGVLHLLLF